MAGDFFHALIVFKNLASGVHNLPIADLRIMLAVPNISTTSDLYVDTTGTLCLVGPTSLTEEIAAGNGYVKGGIPLTITFSGIESPGYKLKVSQALLTAIGGTIGPFLTAILYDNSASVAATRPLIGYWVLSSSLFPITLLENQTLVLNFDQSLGLILIRHGI